jgi:hypothetical protein
MIGDQEIQNLLGDTVLNQIRSGTTSGGRAGEKIWIKTSKGSIQGTCIKDLAPGECTSFLADDGQWYITGGDVRSEVNNSRQISYRRTVQSEAKKEPIVAILYSVTEVVEEERPCICSDRWFYIPDTSIYRKLCAGRPYYFIRTSGYEVKEEEYEGWKYNYDHGSQLPGWSSREEAIANSPIFSAVDVKKVSVNGVPIDSEIPPYFSNSITVETFPTDEFQARTYGLAIYERTELTINGSVNSSDGEWIVAVNVLASDSPRYQGNSLNTTLEFEPRDEVYFIYLIINFQCKLTGSLFTEFSLSIEGVPVDRPIQTVMKHYYLKVNDQTKKIISLRTDDFYRFFLAAQESRVLLRIPAGKETVNMEVNLPLQPWCKIKSFEMLPSGKLKEELLNKPNLPTRNNWQTDYIAYDRYVSSDNPCVNDYISNLGANIKGKTLYICNLEQFIDGRRLKEILKTEPVKASVEKRLLNVVENECQKGEPKFINLKIDALGVDNAVNPQDVGLEEGQTIDPESIEIEAISIYL